jgi:hypothetical protein
MKKEMVSDFARLALAAALVVFLTACAATNPTGPAEQSAKAAVVDEPVEPWEGDGLDIPLDGSSLEAFNSSLARVKAHTSPANYTTLVNAIDYLLVYDLAANRDRTKLAANLDGLSGRQVIGKVRWRKD